MTTKEAQALLADAPRTENPSAVNPSLTQRQAVNIVCEGLAEDEENSVLSDIYEKRVYQVVRNQRRPRY